MKAQKYDLKLQSTKSCFPEQQIEKVVYPFYPIIQTKQINIFFTRKNDFCIKIEADWKKYKLALFNIIQNAVKYNRKHGDLCIIISCNAISYDFNSDKEEDSDAYMLETEIIDTGIGISSER